MGISYFHEIWFLPEINILALSQIDIVIGCDFLKWKNYINFILIFLYQQIMIFVDGNNII